MRNDYAASSGEMEPAQLNNLINKLYHSKKSGFYRKIWGKTCLDNDIVDFDRLPSIGTEDILRRKFNDRIYVTKGLFVKISYHKDAPFLIARTKSELKSEDFGEVNYERPLVVFGSSHETLEKGLWLYGKNILPLPAEENTNLALVAAGRYGIDSVVGDNDSIRKISQSGDKYFDGKNILNLTVIDSRFDKITHDFFENYFPNARIQLVVSLPETGALAKLCEENTSKGLVFHPAKNTFLQPDATGEIIATRTILLPTPIVKYRTGIIMSKESKKCPCPDELCLIFK